MSGIPANVFEPTCTVVICTRDRPLELDRCLCALKKVRYPLDTLVVDSAPSNDAGFEIAVRHRARYALESVPGLSRARNVGARHALGDVIAYLDDDALPEPGWLPSLIREFQDPRVMAVTGRVLPFSVDAGADPLYTAHAMRPPRSDAPVKVDCNAPYWFQLTALGGMGIGANMAFRATAFHGWSGFDERLGRGADLDGGEEHFAFFTLVDGGFRVAYTPHAVVRHPDPPTIDALRARLVLDDARLAAYLTFLYFEAPAQRRAILRHATEAFLGRPRVWRGESRKPRSIVPRWRRVLASLAGPLVYARSWIGRRSLAAPTAAETALDAG